MSDRPRIKQRPTSRVIVLDPDNRILLFRAMLGRSLEPDRLPNATAFWALPGGGIERRETPEEAAKRELAEETGIKVEGSLPLVAVRDVTFVWNGKSVRTLEHFFFTRANSPVLDTSGWLDGDRRFMRDLGWWTLGKLRRTRDIVRPPGLADLARALSQGELPDAPLMLPEK